MIVIICYQIFITKQFNSDCLSRPQSWGPQFPCKKRDRRLDYQCYSQLLTYIQDPTTTSSYPAPVSTTTTTSSQGDGSCPQSSLARCTCDLELELSGKLPVIMICSNSDYLHIILQTDLLPTITFTYISISILPLQPHFSPLYQGQHLYGFKQL